MTLFGFSFTGKSRESTCVCVCGLIIHPPDNPYMCTYEKSSYSARWLSVLGDAGLSTTF